MNFSFSGQIDPVAAYAALLSTVIACWELIKWRSKNAIKLSCNANMLFLPRQDDNKYITATVINVGETQTTITHFLGYYWETWLDKARNKNTEAFIVNSPEVPKLVQPGEQWIGRALQTKDMEKKASEGYLYMGVMHSMSSRAVMRRIKINKTAKNSKKDKG